MSGCRQLMISFTAVMVTCLILLNRRLCSLCRGPVSVGIVGAATPISVTTVWNFIERQVKFNAFLYPNEHPERNCLFPVRQFDVELVKIWYIFSE